MRSNSNKFRELSGNWRRDIAAQLCNSKQLAVEN